MINIENKRESSNVFSIMKAWGIILMVLGHTNSITHDFIYLFHMPLFFIISGYFIKSDNSFNIKSYILKRIKKLYFPFIIWNICFILLHNLFYYLGIYKNDYIGYKIFISRLIDILTFSRSEPLLHPLWFLKSLFFCSIFVYIIVNITKKMKFPNLINFLVFFILFIVGYFLKIKYNSFTYDIHREFISCFVIYIGYILQHNKKFFSTNIFIFIFCSIILLYSSKYITFNLIAADIVNPIFFIFLSLLGVYFIFYISCYTYKASYISNLFIFIGKNTLIILILHLSFFKLFTLVRIKAGIYSLSLNEIFNNGINEFDCLLYTIVGVSLPLILKLIFSKK